MWTVGSTRGICAASQVRVAADGTATSSLQCCNDRTGAGRRGVSVTHPALQGRRHSRIIDKDAFGLLPIFLQVKRHTKDSTVARPAIQELVSTQSGNAANH